MIGAAAAVAWGGGIFTVDPVDTADASMAARSFNTDELTATGLFPSDDGDSGTLRTVPQWGHFPFRPANLAGTRIPVLQAEHENAIVPAAEREAEEEPEDDGAAPATGIGSADGTVRTAPQPGHFPFRPAALSGTRIPWPHEVQRNWIITTQPSLKGLSAAFFATHEDQV